MAEVCHWGQALRVHNLPVPVACSVFSVWLKINFSAFCSHSHCLLPWLSLHDGLLILCNYKPNKLFLKLILVMAFITTKRTQYRGRGNDSVVKQLLFLQRTRVWFPIPISSAHNPCSSSSRGSNTFFWPQLVPIHICTDRHRDIHVSKSKTFGSFCNEVPPSGCRPPCLVAL